MGLEAWYKGGPSKWSFYLGFRCVLDSIFTGSRGRGGLSISSGSAVKAQALGKSPELAWGCFLPLKMPQVPSSLFHDCILKPDWLSLTPLQIVTGRA